MTDQQEMERFIRGEDEAFERLWLKYYRSLYGFFWKLKQVEELVVGVDRVEITEEIRKIDTRKRVADFLADIKKTAKDARKKDESVRKALGYSNQEKFLPWLFGKVGYRFGMHLLHNSR